MKWKRQKRTLRCVVDWELQCWSHLGFDTRSNSHEVFQQIGMYTVYCFVYVFSSRYLCELLFCRQVHSLQGSRVWHTARNRKYKKRSWWIDWKLRSVSPSVHSRIVSVLFEAYQIYASSRLYCGNTFFECTVDHEGLKTVHLWSYFLTNFQLLQRFQWKLRKHWSPPKKLVSWWLTSNSFPHSCYLAEECSSPWNGTSLLNWLVFWFENFNLTATSDSTDHIKIWRNITYEYALIQNQVLYFNILNSLCT